MISLKHKITGAMYDVSEDAFKTMQKKGYDKRYIQVNNKGVTKQKNIVIPPEVENLKNKQATAKEKPTPPITTNDKTDNKK